MMTQKSMLLKRVISFLLCAAVVLSMVGCEKDIDSNNISNSSAETSHTAVNSGEAIPDVDNAIQQVAKLGEEYGYENALSELTEKNTTTVDGDTYYRLQQNYQGIPVYGRTAVYVENENGGMTAVTGNTLDVDANIYLTPTVTAEQVNSAIKEYLVSELGYDAPVILDSGIDKLDKENLCVYNLDSEGTSRLAYCVYVNGYEFVVDARDGTILFADSKIRNDEKTVVGDLAGQERTYESVVHTVKDNEYYLVDLQKNISTFKVVSTTIPKEIFDLNFIQLYQLIDVWSSSVAVTWNKNNVPDPSAVDAYANTQITYDYFSQVLNNKSTDGAGKASIVVVTGLEYAQSNTDNEATEYKNWYDNAYSYSDKSRMTTQLVFGTGSFGQEDLANYLDTVAHEYMHGVEAFHVGMSYTGESGAIMEALSDIFGELVESWDKEKTGKANVTPDWKHNTNRNLSKPQKTGNPCKYQGENWVDTSSTWDNGGVHNNSTVISHAAYLMWNGIDGDESKKISTDDLAKLWYRAMLMMPSDCDFATCRELVEIAARNMDMTAAQLNCIAEAFNTVGIENGDTVLIGTESTYLQIFDINNEPYNNYTLYIAPTETTALPNTPELSAVIERSTDTRIVTTTDPQLLTLEEGSYAIAFVDNADPEKYKVWSLWVNGEQTKTTISISTDFGATKAVTKQLSRIVEYDIFGEITATYDFKYNHNGQLATFTENYNYGLSAVSNYTYDDNGRIVTYTVDATDNDNEYGFIYPDTSEADRQRVLNSIPYVREYDADGNIKSESVFTLTANLCESKYVYSSDLLRLDITTLVTAQDGSTFYEYETHERTIDKEGHVILDTVQSETPYGTFESTNMYCYDYSPFIIKTHITEGSISDSLNIQSSNGVELASLQIGTMLPLERYQGLEYDVDTDGCLRKITVNSIPFSSLEFEYVETGSTNNDEDTITANSDLLTDYYWYLNIQSWEIYSFNEDGTYDIYWCEMPLMPPTENTTFSPDELTPALGGGTYTFDGDRLVLRKDNSDTELVMDLYNKSNNPANLKGGAETDVTEYDGNYYFYQTDWEPHPEWSSDNASYLVRLGKKQIDQDVPTVPLNTRYRGYITTLEEHVKKSGEDKVKYTLYDIDKDGSVELIVQEDTWWYYIYTYDGTNALLCEKTMWWYPDCLYEYDGNGIIVWDGGMGSMHIESVCLYTLTFGGLHLSKYLATTATGDCTVADIMECLDSYTPIADFYAATDYTPLTTGNP